MTSILDRLKAELEQFGLDNDAANKERGRRMLNITRETGEFLSVLVRTTRAQRILEIGTSNGYSTLWLAEAAATTGGVVTTLEKSDYKIGLATTNFKRAGLTPIVSLVQGDAGAFLQSAANGEFDLIFLDSERGQYSAWWPEIRRVLRHGGLLVVDNATSHPAEMAPFATLVSQFTVSTVPVGNGELLAVKG